MTARENASNASPPPAAATKTTSTGRARSGLVVAGSGAASGLIASLAISALVLLAERVAALPVGTFYIMLASAVSHTADFGAYAVAQGLLMHLAAGTALGALLAAPFAASKRAYGSLGRLAPAYGLAAGALIWLVFFVPVTYGVMVPLLGSLDSQSVISQRSPSLTGGMDVYVPSDPSAPATAKELPPMGDLFKVMVGELLSMMDRVVYMELAFNMFYGLIALMLTRSFAEALLN
ncbi:MAG: hypothetical protein C4292_05670, partial [Nitrososphaera sp.]